MSESKEPFTFVRVDPSHGERAYRVMHQGWRMVGTVELVVTESWRTTPTGVRYGLRGHVRHWHAVTPAGERVTTTAYRRRDAATALLEREGAGDALAGGGKDGATEGR